MNKKTKEIVRMKFDGLCAYTGKPLRDDWQVDHMQSKYSFEKILIRDARMFNPKTGEEMTIQEHAELVLASIRNTDEYYSLRGFKRMPAIYKPHKDCDKIENLIPALKIVNHYKRQLDLEGFRRYMSGFHLRLKKLPKKAVAIKTKQRIEYMNTIADLFGITQDKPFSGNFYFETL